MQQNKDSFFNVKYSRHVECGIQHIRDVRDFANPAVITCEIKGHYVYEIEDVNSRHV